VDDLLYNVLYLLSLTLLCEGHPTFGGQNEKKDISFEFFHLAQFWPPTSCYIYFGEEVSSLAYLSI